MIQRPPTSTLFPTTTRFRSPAGITPQAEERLADGLAQAANVSGIARAAGRSYTLHATGHTGRIATRRLQKFRKRSEGHTPEFQSRQYLFCRFQLEKQKTDNS